ncbi:MAG: hypothetical protein LBO05_14230 [Deltaproteobacteria bacterium]|nr:hypothetical protein [Deltaproteobacteria bacterium]
MATDDGRPLDDHAGRVVEHNGPAGQIEALKERPAKGDGTVAPAAGDGEIMRLGTEESDAWSRDMEAPLSPDPSRGPETVAAGSDFSDSSAGESKTSSAEALGQDSPFVELLKKHGWTAEKIAGVRLKVTQIVVDRIVEEKDKLDAKKIPQEIEAKVGRSYAEACSLPDFFGRLKEAARSGNFDSLTSLMAGYVLDGYRRQPTIKELLEKLGLTDVVSGWDEAAVGNVVAEIVNKKKLSAKIVKPEDIKEEVEDCLAGLYASETYSNRLAGVIEKVNKDLYVSELTNLLRRAIAEKNRDKLFQMIRESLKYSSKFKARQIYYLAGDSLSTKKTMDSFAFGPSSDLDFFDGDIKTDIEPYFDGFKAAEDVLEMLLRKVDKGKIKWEILKDLFDQYSAVKRSTYLPISFAKSFIEKKYPDVVKELFFEGHSEKNGLYRPLKDFIVGMDGRKIGTDAGDFLWFCEGGNIIREKTPDDENSCDYFFLSDEEFDGLSYYEGDVCELKDGFRLCEGPKITQDLANDEFFFTIAKYLVDSYVASHLTPAYLPVPVLLDYINVQYGDEVLVRFNQNGRTLSDDLTSFLGKDGRFVYFSKEEAMGGKYEDSKKRHSSFAVKVRPVDKKIFDGDISEINSEIDDWLREADEQNATKKNNAGEDIKFQWQFVKKEAEILYDKFQENYGPIYMPILALEIYLIKKFDYESLSKWFTLSRKELKEVASEVSLYTNSEEKWINTNLYDRAAVKRFYEDEPDVARDNELDYQIFKENPDIFEEWTAKFLGEIEEKRKKFMCLYYVNNLETPGKFNYKDIREMLGSECENPYYQAEKWREQIESFRKKKSDDIGGWNDNIMEEFEEVLKKKMVELARQYIIEVIHENPDTLIKWVEEFINGIGKTNNANILQCFGDLYRNLETSERAHDNGLKKCSFDKVMKMVENNDVTPNNQAKTTLEDLKNFLKKKMFVTENLTNDVMDSFALEFLAKCAEL